jgi:NitT/TauT family transport system ATP-binding protein
MSFNQVARAHKLRGGGTYTAVADVSFEVEDGEFVSIVGPSGCGKSTLLDAAAGIALPTAGTVHIDNSQVAGIRTDIGYVFQRDALLPWKRVVENVELPLRYRGIRGAEAQERIDTWLRRIGLEGFARYYPHQLSGGMRKRVSLAQALIYDPSVILMDEPFSALDVQTRNKMETELLTLCTNLDKTVLFVTHDLEEAIALSDRVIVLTAGPASSIKDIFRIPLARPRDVAEARFAPGYAEVYEEIWGALRDEVDKSYARQQQAAV